MMKVRCGWEALPDSGPSLFQLNIMFKDIIARGLGMPWVVEVLFLVKKIYFKCTVFNLHSAFPTVEPMLKIS